jgi:hypothetical protein
MFVTDTHPATSRWFVVPDGWAGQFWVRVKTMDFSISEMDLSICAPKNNNHINCIIIILNFVNLSLKENVIINV